MVCAEEAENSRGCDNVQELMAEVVGRAAWVEEGTCQLESSHVTFDRGDRQDSKMGSCQIFSNETLEESFRTLTLQLRLSTLLRGYSCLRV